MATIRKHREKYQVQVRRKGYPPISRSFLRLADAKEWARKIETEADRRDLAPDRKVLDSLTLGQLVTRYRDEVVPAKKSADIERIILDAFLRNSICRKTLSELTTADFAAYRDERLREITAKSLKRQLSPLSNMFEVAKAEWKLPLRENPLLALSLKVTDRKRERRLRDGEIHRLAKAAAKSRNKSVFQVALFALETAMRRGEILSMRWEDVSLERQSVVIPDSKNGRSRIIPLTPSALLLLREQLASQRSAKGRSGMADRASIPSSSVAVTCQSRDRDVLQQGPVLSISATALRLSWERLCKRADVDDLHFHDLRHEAISRLFEKGLTVPEVASISGHRDMRMLFRYAHASHQAIRQKLLDGDRS